MGRALTSIQPIISLPVGHTWCGIPNMVNFLIRQHPVERTRRGRRYPIFNTTIPKILSLWSTRNAKPCVVLARERFIDLPSPDNSLLSGCCPRWSWFDNCCLGQRSVSTVTSLVNSLVVCTNLYIVPVSCHVHWALAKSKPCRILPRPHGSNTRRMNDSFSSIKYLNNRNALKILIYLPLRLNTRSR